MTVVACYSLKGGVGKTAAAVNLAYLSGREGARTLVWDLDPQGSASFYFRVKPKMRGGFQRVIRRKKDPRRAIRGTDFQGLDLLPADFAARNLDLLLDRSRRPKRELSRFLRALRKEYDRVFIDCTPSIGLGAEGVFRAADVLVVPTIPTTLSMETLDRLKKHFRSKKRRPGAVWPFFSMVDSRKTLHRDICERDGSLPFKFLESRIPYSSDVERMGVHRAPVQTFAAASAAGQAYRSLADEIAGRLSKGRKAESAA